MLPGLLLLMALSAPQLQNPGFEASGSGPRWKGGMRPPPKRQSAVCSSSRTLTGNIPRRSCRLTWNWRSKAVAASKSNSRNVGRSNSTRPVFSYIAQDDGTERTVAVPEQRGKGAISQDPLPPGSLYTVAADAEGKVGLFRLEVFLTAGTGKIRTPAGLEKGVKESLNRAVSYLQVVKEKLGLTSL